MYSIYNESSKLQSLCYFSENSLAGGALHVETNISEHEEKNINYMSVMKGDRLPH